MFFAQVVRISNNSSFLLKNENDLSAETIYRTYTAMHENPFSFKINYVALP